MLKKFYWFQFGFRELLRSQVKPRVLQDIAVLGHIILQEDVLHDTVIEVFGKTMRKDLRDQLKDFDNEVAEIPGIKWV